MKRFLIALAAAAGACAPDAAEAPETGAGQPAAAAAPTPAAAVPSAEGLPAGSYVLDKSHSTVTFGVSHLGFSTFVAGFDEVDAALELDPANPGSASLLASAKTASLDIPAPPEGFLDELMGEQWFDAAKFPEITFKSTAVSLTGPNTADVTGDLTLKGVTRPVTLKATFNGGWAGIPPDPNARIGFSAAGVLKRSEFGMAFGVPEPGSTMGVSDEVRFEIETEFSGPAWTPPAPTAG
jgi:polyisoprenoid-binding protein YceI